MSRELLQKARNHLAVLTDGVHPLLEELDAELNSSERTSELEELKQQIVRIFEELQEQNARLQAKFDKGIRVHAFIEGSTYEAVEFKEERNLRHNATLIPDEPL